MLAAQANSSFNATFKAAQSEITNLQNQINALNKLQRDITAFQRQQEAVKKTSEHLSVLQQRYQMLGDRIANFHGDPEKLGAMNDQFLRLGEQVKNTSTALTNQQAALHATAQRLHDAGVNTSNLSEEQKRLAAEEQRLMEQQGQLTASLEEYSQQSNVAFDIAANSIIESGLADALGKITDAYKECINIAAEFQYSMSKVEAISGSSSDDMSDLTAKAKELGATTKFTATEVSEGMSYMAMAGWKAEEMIAGMDGVVALAAAGGEDLATTTSIVADSLAAFGLTANDTAHFADVLAAAATNANTDVSLIGETFKTAAPIAGALGFSIEDVSVAMGLMANNGIKGSRAGTALRNIFNGLVKDMTLTSGAFGEIEYSTINADGTMKSFSEVVNDLRGYFNQMTGAEQIANAKNIATMRGYAGLLAILNATNEDYAQLTDSINNCNGAAQRMANVRLDNYNGQVIIMQSAWDALKTTIGEAFLPVLQKLVEGLTSVISGVNEFLVAHPVLLKAILGFTTAVAGAMAALQAYAAVKKSLEIAKLAGLFTPVTGAALATVAAIGLLTAGIVTMIELSKSGAEVENLGKSIKTLGETMTSTSKEFDDSMHEISGTESLARDYVATLERLEQQGNLSAEQQREYNLTVEKLRTIMPDLNLVLDEETGLLMEGTNAIYDQIEAWKQEQQQLALRRKFQSQIEAYADAELEYAIASGKALEVENQIAVVEDKQSKNLARRTELYDQISEGYANYNNLTEEEINNLDTLEDEYYQLQGEALGYDDELARLKAQQKDYNGAMDTAQKEMDRYSGEINKAQAALDTYNNTLETSNADEETHANNVNDVIDAYNDAAEQIDELTKAYDKAKEAAEKSLNKQYDLWDKADRVVATKVSSMTSNIEGQTTYWTNYNDNIEYLIGLGDKIPGLTQMLASFADGSKESVNAVQGMANASEEDLQKMVDQWLQLNSVRETLAENLAQIETDYDNTLNYIVDSTANAVAEMDLSDDAKTAAIHTIEGFINGALDKEQAVYDAYFKVGSAGIRALDDAYVIHSPSHVMADKAGWVWEGFIKGTEDMSQDVVNAMTGTVNDSLSAMDGSQIMTFSPALMSAIAGLDPVGVQSSGGAAAPVSVNVAFNIEGNADASTVNALAGYGDDFAERVRAVIEDTQDDARRRNYI